MVRDDRGARDLGYFPIPGCLLAIDPRNGLSYLLAGGGKGFLVLGGVFLYVTGAEALYADMGHFGAGRSASPGRRSFSRVSSSIMRARPLWSWRARHLGQHLLPAVPLLLALAAHRACHDRDDHRQPVDHNRRILDDASGDTARLAATVHITQTSAEGYGQIYVGSVNWLLMLVTLGLTVGFGKSDNLASAYGIAVSATMLMTRRCCSSRCARSGGGASSRQARSPALHARRCRVLRSEFRQGGAGRIRAADPGCPRLRHHADLASRSDSGHGPASGCGYARRSNGYAFKSLLSKIPTARPRRLPPIARRRPPRPFPRLIFQRGKRSALGRAL